MIDIENQVFQALYEPLVEKFDGIFVSGEYVPTPSTFPFVSVMQQDCYDLQSTQDSASMENHVVVMYEVNVYSNLKTGKKSQCKAIFSAIDDVFHRLNFTKQSLNVVPNINNATIYRMTGRYTAIVSKAEVIYGR